MLESTVTQDDKRVQEQLEEEAKSKSSVGVIEWPSKGSSDEDACAMEASSDNDAQGSFSGLSTKCGQIIKQGIQCFEEFFNPWVLEVSKKTDLYALLDYYRSGIQ